MSNDVEARQSPWWADAVVYQVYLRSFADSDGDGNGDLEGLRRRLGHLEDLGVDALWLTPCFPSPQADGGYDVADYYDIDPLYGDLAAFDALLADAHRRSLRLLIDLVPNHTSREHPWFQAALADPAAPERAYYHFVDPGPDGQVPNNWKSCFGGPAWTLDEASGQYYLHLFSSDQPDLNWDHPAVAAEFERILRFWLDRGVDGVRIDVAAGLLKDAAYRDNPGEYAPGLFGHGPEQVHTWNQPQTLGVWERWRAIADEYPGERALVGEVCLADAAAVASYADSGRLHSAFCFRLLKSDWDPQAWTVALNEPLDAFSRVAGVPAWTLGNHDKDRQVTRFGGGERGTARARAAALLLLALPGTVYLYAGDELGLPQAELTDEDLRDPIFVRSGGTRRGRDGCRIPMPWDEHGPTLGFSAASTHRGWLPTPPEWAALSAAAQSDDSSSILSLYRRTLRLRTDLRLGLGAATVSVVHGTSILQVHVQLPEQAVTCLLNMGEAATPLPAGVVLLCASADDAVRAGALQPDHAVWVATPQSRP